MLQIRQFISFLVLSIFFHLCLVSFLAHWKFPTVASSEEQKTFTIDLADQDLLQELKTAGIKGGSKINSVMIKDPPKTANASARVAKQTKHDGVRTNQASIARQLGQLKATTSEKGPVMAHVIQEPLARYGASALSRSKLAQGANLGVHFEVPEGVDISELNESELVFYSFKRRIAQSFINTLFNVYDKFTLSNPHVRIPVPSLAETLTGQLIFDVDGKIKEVKIMKSSQDEKTQEFFEEVLDNIRGLPNPPKALINTSGQFVVYFSLLMNG